MILKEEEEGGREGVRDCHRALGAALELAGKQDPGQAARVPWR